MDKTEVAGLVIFATLVLVTLIKLGLLALFLWVVYSLVMAVMAV